MYQHLAHQVNMSRKTVLCASDSRNFFEHPVYSRNTSHRPISHNFDEKPIVESLYQPLPFFHTEFIPKASYCPRQRTVQD